MATQVLRARILDSTRVTLALKRKHGEVFGMAVVGCLRALIIDLGSGLVGCSPVNSLGSQGFKIFEWDLMS